MNVATMILDPTTENIDAIRVATTKPKALWYGSLVAMSEGWERVVCAGLW